MPKGFLPVRDQDLMLWAQSFAARIQQPPADGWLSPDRIAAFVQAFEDYAQALARCVPSEQSQSVTRAKNAARAVLRQRAGECSRIIQANPDVSDPQRIALGLSVRKPPTRIGRPDDIPTVEPTMEGRRLTVQLSTMLGRRRKPHGVAGARVYGCAGQRAAEDPTMWTLLGTTSTSVFRHDFSSDMPPGTPIWVAACWFNPRTECGPTSEPRQTWIQFGGPMLITSNLKAA